MQQAGSCYYCMV